MTRKEAVLKGKVGPGFEARLSGLGPRGRIQATVLLRSASASEASARRQSRTDRRATIDALRRSVRSALVDIDRILDRHGGRRLAPEVDALGSVAVETTVAGLVELAASDYVKAILEDQPLVRVQGGSA